MFRMAHFFAVFCFFSTFAWSMQMVGNQPQSEAKSVIVQTKHDFSIRLEKIDETELANSTNLNEDLSLALESFSSAFSQASEEVLEENFGLSKDIKAFYGKLLFEDDIIPFRDGKLIWIRAFLDNKLVGWMTLQPNFERQNTVYLSTLVVDPAFQSLGIGKILLNSIANQWLPDTQEICLVVREINQKAQGFYHRLGFHYIGSLEKVSHCLWMQWLLKAP